MLSTPFSDPFSVFATFPAPSVSKITTVDPTFTVCPSFATICLTLPVGRGDLHRGLVSHHFDHRLVFLDLLSFRNQPLDYLPFGYSLSKIWKLELNRHSLYFSHSSF